jgi:flavin reductase (DIM6/NTAB) family NADH-FMN oxidoreductase RutF/rubredoxin
MDINAFRKLNYGMYVVSSKIGNKFNGQIANTVFQVASEPPVIAISINKQNLTHLFISESKVFTVSVISQDASLEFIGRFGFRSGREYSKFGNTHFDVGKSGAPIVMENAAAYLEAKVISSIDAGTHTVFLGEVTNGEVINNDAEPMTYAYYHTMKHGTAPKTAPTFIDPDKANEAAVEKSNKYKCTLCGYVYDPSKGDPEAGITPGTTFEQLPETWACPVCGAPKSSFKTI